MSLSIPFAWGDLPAERAWPCDGLISGADHVLYRSVEVDANPDRLFAWLCQLRAAPYSYDWIDNIGCRSPRQLTPGLTNLKIGQTVMSIFDLVSFEPNNHITIVIKPGSRAEALFGQVAGTYAIKAGDQGGLRLVAKLLVRYPPGWYGRLLRRVLPWGDLLMMRKQLLTLKHFAEQNP